MLVVKYQKQDEARFISHIDMLREASRIIRRADIPVKFSQGFNPHALVFFSPPSAVGVGSKAEYISIDADMSAGDALCAFNKAVPKSMSASKVFVCAKNPNLQAIVTAADFLFDVEFSPLDFGDEFVIEYKKKGEIVSENVRDKIFGVFEKDGKLSIRLASGNSGLRPDRMLGTMEKKFGMKLNVLNVQKLSQYVTLDGEFLCVDKYLQSLASEVAEEGGTK